MADKVKSKMDYKKMTTKELLSLISDQAINEEINEGHKLIIQDVVKELFEKKCEKYKKVSYCVVKKFNDHYCDSCCDDMKQTCNCDNECQFQSYSRSRIMRYLRKGEGGTTELPHENFPNQLHENQLKMFEQNGSYGVDTFRKTYVITKIEDIEC